MSIVTYEEMCNAREVYATARQEFSLKYHYFLDTVLSEAGVHNKLVRIKSTGLMGQFKVSHETSSSRPWVINFHPLTKDGRVSMRSKYLYEFNRWKEDTLIQQLKEICEVIGEVVGDLSCK